MTSVTCALIIHQNKILLTQRGATCSHSFKWEFPGGKVKENESLENCLIREIKEELNLDIEIREAMFSVQHQYDSIQIELHPFLCRIISGKIKPVEHHDFTWVCFNDLRNFDFTEADMKLIHHRGNKKILKKHLRENVNNSG